MTNKVASPEYLLKLQRDEEARINQSLNGYRRQLEDASRGIQQFISAFGLEIDVFSSELAQAEYALPDESKFYVSFHDGLYSLTKFKSARENNFIIKNKWWDDLSLSQALDRARSLLRPAAQLEQARELLELLKTASGADKEEALKALQDVLEDAQNAPPLGKADGSINQEQWYVLRDFVDYQVILDSKFQRAQTQLFQ